MDQARIGAKLDLLCAWTREVAETWTLNSKGQDPLLQELQLHGLHPVRPPPNARYIRLYGHYLCPDVECVLITLALKQIPYQFVNMDLEKRPEWFRALGSNGSVPLLELQDRRACLADALPICEYLDETCSSEHDLMPKHDLVLRAKLRATISRADTLAGNHSKLFQSLGQDQAAALALRNDIDAINTLLKDNDNKHPYLHNQQHLTLADVMLLPYFRRILLMEHTPLYDVWTTLKLYDCPHLLRWYTNMMQLEAIALHTVSLPAYKRRALWSLSTKTFTFPIRMSQSPFTSP